MHFLSPAQLHEGLLIVWWSLLRSRLKRSRGRKKEEHPPARPLYPLVWWGSARTDSVWSCAPCPQPLQQEPRVGGKRETQAILPTSWPHDTSALLCMQSLHLLCPLPGHEPLLWSVEVAEDSSISNTVARGRPGRRGAGKGREGAGWGTWGDNAATIWSLPKGNHHQMCLWCCSRTLRRELRGTLWSSSLRQVERGGQVCSSSGRWEEERARLILKAGGSKLPPCPLAGGWDAKPWPRCEGRDREGTQGVPSLWIWVLSAAALARRDEAPAGGRSGPWGGRARERRSPTPKAKASEATWVTILAAPRASETLLLLPHCLASWVATSLGQRGSAKHCMIRRGRAGLGGGQEQRARRTGGKKLGSRSPLPPQCLAALQVPASFLLPTETPPRSAPIAAQSPTDLVAYCCHAGSDIAPSHRFKPTGLCACTCSFVHRQRWRERKVGASFSQALHCASARWQLCQGGGEVGSQERRLWAEGEAEEVAARDRDAGLCCGSQWW